MVWIDHTLDSSLLYATGFTIKHVRQYNIDSREWWCRLWTYVIEEDKKARVPRHVLLFL